MKKISWGLSPDPWDDRAFDGVIPSSCSQGVSFVCILYSKSLRGRVRLALTDTDTDTDTDTELKISKKN